MGNVMFNKLPNHIAFILDGNGRWAKKLGLSRTSGHLKGINTLKNIIKEVKNLGIKYMSVYCFSVENFDRPKEEVDFLMDKAYTEFKKIDLKKIDFNIRIIGERTRLDSKMLEAIDQVNSTSFIEDRFTLFVAFNYSSQLEIVNAAKEMKSRKLAFTKENFEKCLYTYPAPFIDLLVRTSHEQRLSNFMLYQASYAELYFPKTLWPAFTKKCLYRALEEYQNRDRRFGKL